MTTRKPKPVRAWAETMSATDRRIWLDPWGRPTIAKTRGWCVKGSWPNNVKPVRVTIVPDDTPSADAEVRRLRKIVRAMVKWHRDVNFPTNCVCVWCEEFGPKRKRAALRGRRGR